MQTWVRPFLSSLQRQGVVVQACVDATISATTVYALKAKDADFAEAWKQALVDFSDWQEQELYRRASGYQVQVLHQGQPIPVWEYDDDGQIVQMFVDRLQPDGTTSKVLVQKQARNPDGSLKWLTETKYSDALLLAAVKANKKSKYAERSEHTGADGAPLEMDDTARAARMAAILDTVSKRKFQDDIA